MHGRQDGLLDDLSSVLLSLDFEVTSNLIYVIYFKWFPYSERTHIVHIHTLCIEV